MTIQIEVNKNLRIFRNKIVMFATARCVNYGMMTGIDGEEILISEELKIKKERQMQSFLRPKVVSD